MVRRAFLMRLKPGALAEYKRRHDEIWPELVEEIKASGIKEFSIFEDDPVLFLYSEIESEDAWDKLWSSDIHHRWAEWFRELMSIREDGIVDSKIVSEVYRFES